MTLILFALVNALIRYGIWMCASRRILNNNKNAYLHNIIKENSSYMHYRK
jgi:hypothetical protein